MSMLVGIDASRSTLARRTGTENYSVGLTRALVERARFRYRLYFRSAPPPDFDGLAFEPRVMPAPRLWTHTRLAWDVLRQPPGVLFVPAHVLPLTAPAASIVTVHDVGFRHFHQAHPPRQRLYLDLTTRWAVRRAAALLADSDATRRDLVHLYRADPARVHIVYPAVGPAFTPDAAPGEAERLQADYGLGRYLLYVGSLQPRKNIGTLIEAFARAQPDATLALAGGIGWGGEDQRLRARVAELGLQARVRFLGHVPAADLPALMRGALALALPSLYEGFGMPLAEAMACGTPVLASNTSSLPEVVGAAGLLLPPTDVAAWADALAQAATDTALRDRLRERGLARARLFTWERAAQGVEEVIGGLEIGD